MEYIKHHPGLIPKDTCRKIIQIYKDDLHRYAKETDYNLQKTVLEASSHNSSKLSEIIDKEISKVVNKAVDNSIPHNLTDSSFYTMENAGLMHHKEGTTIPYHYDAPYQGENVSDLACLLYLNDEFEGGELIFPLQNKIIKPGTGDILVFPTNCFFPHLTTINSGAERYVLRMNYYYAKPK